MSAVLGAHEAAALADQVEAAAFAELFAAAPTPLVERLGLSVRTIAGATALFAPGMPTTMFNRVIGLGLERPATADDLAALRQAYAATGSQAYWLHWNPLAEPVGGADWIAAQGFTTAARRSWAKMLRDASPPPQVETTLDVALTGANQVGATAAAIAKAFGMPPFMGDWLGALYGRPDWRVYSIADDGQVVGGACLFTATIAGQRVGWLGMGAVLASHRRRGGQRAAMALRIADAAAAGCCWAATETGEAIGDEANPSLSNMQHLGFACVASRLNFEPAPA